MLQDYCDSTRGGLAPRVSEILAGKQMVPSDGMYKNFPPHLPVLVKTLSEISGGKEIVPRDNSKFDPCNKA